jgi:hypothetical protein
VRKNSGTTVAIPMRVGTHIGGCGALHSALSSVVQRE